MINLSKVFNTVYHKLLIDNLAAYGKSYYGSKIIWEIRKQESLWMELNQNGTNGVPQGIILGPLLFVRFMNDLPNTVEECSIAPYTDDIML